MGERSGIEWTGKTWNPVVGCSRVSAGCTHCYAERMAWRHVLMCRARDLVCKYEGTVHLVGGEPRWTGVVKLDPDALDLPLRWRKPRRIFVNSMSDLFHEKVDDAWIGAIFAVMAVSPRHTYQILTKRPERMHAWMMAVNVDPAKTLEEAAYSAWETVPEDFDCLVHNYVNGWSRFKSQPADGNPLNGTVRRWPLPNVWLGVSVEDQAMADARIPLLLQTPAAIRFVSYEPALGSVDWGHWLYKHTKSQRRLDWLIVGGESGPGARPFHVRWMRAARDQCRAAGVPIFCKQMGSFVVDRNDAGFTGWDDGDGWPDGTEIEEHIHGYREDHQGADVRVKLRDRKGGSMEEWPEDLRIREFPRG